MNFSTQKLAGAALFGGYLAAHELFRPFRDGVTLAERLANLPRTGLPCKRPVKIRWNDRQVPFLEAETDRDLAVGLGVVHAHLRLGQMEVMRRLAYGRVAEMVGPIGIELDRSLRILDFPRAVPAIVESLPAETREWVQGFVDGINHAVRTMAALPREFVLFGLKREPWTVAHIIAVGRMASADVSWILWLQLLKMRGTPGWAELWGRLTRDGASPLPAAESGPVALDEALRDTTITGSNSVAVSGGRSGTGSALIASDPHLGIIAPGVWLIAGYRSPSYNAVGFMIPGLPFIALGRNPEIAWGGTSLHAASSDLFDADHLAAGPIRARRETIKVRWWRDQKITLRETDLGPVLSDSPFLGKWSGQPIALRWIGHLPSDEMTAMLGINRARNWEEYRRAAAGLAIPGQNLIYADSEGHIGRSIGARLPRRPADAPGDLIADPRAATHWDEFVSGADLPASFDPPGGFVASSNERPEPSDVPVGFLFSPGDRSLRLRQLLAGDFPIGTDMLRSVQRDTYSQTALELRDLVLGAIPADQREQPERHDLVEALTAWDGHYRADSAGALAHELLVYYLVEALHPKDRFATYAATWDPRGMITEDFAAAAPAALSRALTRALDAATPKFRILRDWGGMHRLSLAHPLGMAPMVGRRYRFADQPASGGNETLMKTAHAVAGDRHRTRYGANARHISDMADPDANWFVLLGGQDGWFGSTTFLDQLPLWQAGDYVQMPLRPDSVAKAFPHVTDLLPTGAP